MPKIDYPEKGEPITAEWARALVDAINDLRQGPPVWAPLVSMDGAIGLGQDYQLYPAIATGTIGARGVVSGSMTWGSGPCRFLTVDLAGKESTQPGYAAFTGWNFTGATIPTGIRVWVCWSMDKWCIVAADCSGVT